MTRRGTLNDRGYRAEPPGGLYGLVRGGEAGVGGRGKRLRCVRLVGLN
jgi:hypothetical protein